MGCCEGKGVVMHGDSYGDSDVRWKGCWWWHGGEGGIQHGIRGSITWRKLRPYSGQQNAHLHTCTSFC